VSLAEMLPGIAEDMEALNCRGLMDALQEKKVTVLTEHEVNEITDEEVIVTNKKNGERKLIEAD
jgi:NADH dehydrogenase FAD-containing subunit